MSSHSSEPRPPPTPATSARPLGIALALLGAVAHSERAQRFVASSSDRAVVTKPPHFVFALPSTSRASSAAGSLVVVSVAEALQSRSVTSVVGQVPVHRAACPVAQILGTVQRAGEYSTSPPRCSVCSTMRSRSARALQRYGAHVATRQRTESATPE